MKLLLIEDNEALVKSLRDFLGKTWKIDTVSSGQEGLERIRSGNYDVIILDLNLPDMNGQEVCKAARQAMVTTPILVLSGSIEPGTKVSLFKCGADDYVTKPFNASELQERLLALLRRGHLDTANPYLLKVDSLILDPLSRQVKRSGKKIVLRRKEFDILEYLIRNRGKVVSRNMIMDNVWEADSDSWNNTVDVHIKYLRDKIDRPFKSQLIKTAHGVGYTISDSV
ncbi:MAG TPA: response regulator transcription factor [Candidatus Saccharimonadales bacterium]|nr:response regulator transcription factor [Candidatus Saccharimonadales bacterium]